jgi:hypothetical protein
VGRVLETVIEDHISKSSDVEVSVVGSDFPLVLRLEKPAEILPIQHAIKLSSKVDVCP